MAAELAAERASPEELDFFDSIEADYQRLAAAVADDEAASLRLSVKANRDFHFDGTAPWSGRFTPCGMYSSDVSLVRWLSRSREAPAPISTANFGLVPKSRQLAVYY